MHFLGRKAHPRCATYTDLGHSTDVLKGISQTPGPWVEGGALQVIPDPPGLNAQPRLHGSDLKGPLTPSPLCSLCHLLTPQGSHKHLL